MFKVGDIITGHGGHSQYGITTSDSICKVSEIGRGPVGKLMRVKVLTHSSRPDEVGNTYTVRNDNSFSYAIKPHDVEGFVMYNKEKYKIVRIIKNKAVLLKPNSKRPLYINKEDIKKENLC